MTLNPPFIISSRLAPALKIADATLQTPITENLMQDSTLTLRLTPNQAYRRKQRLFELFHHWQRRIINAFYPDTGGSGHLMHNWYRCSKNPALADWIEESTWARYRRLESIMESRDVLREHLHHVNQTVEEFTPVKRNGKTSYVSSRRPFNPLWCPICQSSQQAPTQPLI